MKNSVLERSAEFALHRSAPLRLCSAGLMLVVAAVAQGTTLSTVSVGVPTAVQGATVVGRLPAATMLSGSVSLAPASRATFEAFVGRLYDPASPDYHRFLTPAEVGARFGASQATINATAAYLRSKGLTITLVAPNGMAILYKGRADKAEAAFSTKLYQYHDGSRTDGPQDFYSFSTAPKLPANVTPSIVSIAGLDSANPPKPRGSLLTPSQARTLYGASDLYASHKGEGVNIGISNFDGYRLSNLNVLYTQFGLPTPTGGIGSNVHKVIVGGVDGETVTEGGEGDLDFQMALAMAPLSNVYIYDGIGGGLVATLTQESTDNTVDIVSESYGWGGGNDFYLAAHDQHLAMEAQGIAYCVASGDTGTDLGGFDYPNFEPGVIMVGGTDATVDTSGNRLTEVGWGGSGSGWSLVDVPFNTLPSYLKGTNVPTTINRRIFPDVALHATGSAYVFGGSPNAVAGTSVASPVFAGQLGLILQALKEQDAVDTIGGRGRLGRFVDFIYSLNGDPTCFFDVTSGDSGPLPNGQEAVAGPAWDFVTGWGAPNDLGLYNRVLEAASVPEPDNAAAVKIYQSSTSPSVSYGTLPVGDVAYLKTTDGVSYSLSSARQSGIGQVAAAQIDFNLQTAKPRRSTTLNLAINSPSLTTEYVYVFDFTANAFTMVKQLNGTGSYGSATIQLDDTKYVQNGKMTVLVRALKPVRMGSSPFRLMVDSANVIERVPRG